MQEDCIDQFDAMDCLAAVSLCESEITAPFRATGPCAFPFLSLIIFRHPYHRSQRLRRVEGALQLSCLALLTAHKTP